MRRIRRANKRSGGRHPKDIIPGRRPKLVDVGLVQGKRDLDAVKTRARSHGLRTTVLPAGKEGRQKVHLVRIYK